METPYEVLDVTSFADVVDRLKSTRFRGLTVVQMRTRKTSILDAITAGIEIDRTGLCVAVPALTINQTDGPTVGRHVPVWVVVGPDPKGTQS